MGGAYNLPSAYNTPRYPSLSIRVFIFKPEVTRVLSFSGFKPERLKLEENQKHFFSEFTKDIQKLKMKEVVYICFLNFWVAGAVINLALADGKSSYRN
jgi:hypothetical protein